MPPTSSQCSRAVAKHFATVVKFLVWGGGVIEKEKTLWTICCTTSGSRCRAQSGGLLYFVFVCLVFFLFCVFFLFVCWLLLFFFFFFGVLVGANVIRKLRFYLALSLLFWQLKIRCNKLHRHQRASEWARNVTEMAHGHHVQHQEAGADNGIHQDPTTVHLLLSGPSLGPRNLSPIHRPVCLLAERCALTGELHSVWMRKTTGYELTHGNQTGISWLNELESKTWTETAFHGPSELFFSFASANEEIWTEEVGVELAICLSRLRHLRAEKAQAHAFQAMQQLVWGFCNSGICSGAIKNARKQMTKNDLSVLSVFEQDGQTTQTSAFQEQLSLSQGENSSNFLIHCLRCRYTKKEYNFIELMRKIMP